MLATMGYITPDLIGKLPGYLSPSSGLMFADVLNELGAISKFPVAGWAQIVFYGAFCDVSHLSLCSLGVNGLRTPPPWVTLRPFQFFAVLLHTFVLGYDF